MRVIFVIKGLTSRGGGAERVLALVSAGLASRGHEISIATFDSDDAVAFYPLNKNVEWIRLGRGGVQIGATIKDMASRVLAIRDLVRQRQPDVTVAFMSSSIVPASLAVLGQNTKFVASEHNVPARYKNKRMEFFLLQLAAIPAERVTVLSDKIRESFPFLLRRKMHPISNPIDPIYAAGNVLKMSQRQRVILSVGRLEAQKDHATLISAFGLAKERLQGWKLKIFGAGPLEDDLRGLVTELGLQDEVLLLGTTTNIEREYQQASMYVSSARFESFGLATAEAMASGLPAIGFANCPGTNELITDGFNGWLVEGTDRPTSLAHAIVKLAVDEAQRERFGENAQKSAQAFDVETVVSRWEELLYEVIQKY